MKNTMTFCFYTILCLKNILPKYVILLFQDPIWKAEWALFPIYRLGNWGSEKLCEGIAQVKKLCMSLYYAIKHVIFTQNNVRKLKLKTNFKEFKYFVEWGEI